MRLFDLYLIRNLFVAMVFIALILAAVILLTQSLRFLELVINSGASALSFWVLTILALPRFLEIILPIALMAATLFIYNKMATDSELVVIRATGYSPMALARPALILAGIVTVALWSVTMWLSPLSLSNMQQKRQEIKAQFSSLLFREGVFNSVGPGLTVYMRSRGEDGELQGLMINDSREKAGQPSTILAKRGVVVANDDGHQVLVYDGLRQEFDTGSQTLRRLNFDRYTIDLPDGGPVRQRWAQPDERTVFELLNPDPENVRDQESLRDFRVEIHKRAAAPFLAFAYTVMALSILLLGPVDRRGQGRRIIMVIASVVAMQGLFLAAFNLARQSDLGLALMYILVLAPMVFCFFMLSSAGENFRRNVLYRARPKGAAS